MNESNDFNLWQREMVAHLSSTVPRQDLRNNVALMIVALDLCRANNWPEMVAVDLCRIFLAAADLAVDNEWDAARDLLVESVKDIRKKHENI
jgi:hypothetical protein